MPEPFDTFPGSMLLENLADPRCMFVFPTQRSADSWAFALARSGRTRAVESERFIGEDRYRSLITELNRPQGFEESSSLSRLFWALGVVVTQRAAPFLKNLLPSGFEVPLSRAHTLSRLAPRLRMIRDAALQGELEFGDDYIALCARYDKFLEEEKFYEPSMLGSEQPDDKKFMLLAPDLSRSPAQGNPEQCRDKEARNNVSCPVLHTFGTFREELDWVFHAIRDLLHEGARPLEIAISLPNLSPELKAHLLRTAREWRVPVNFFDGEPLSQSPFGRLLASVSKAASEGFSARTLRKLAENNPIRWQNHRSFRALISIAERFNIPEMSDDPGRMAELWSLTFSECRINDAGAASLYRLLLEKSRAIRGAGTFRALMKALFDFRTAFLDETSLDSYTAKTLQRIFDELEKLNAMHERLRSPKLPAQPLAILLLELERTPYSPVMKADAVSIQSYTLGVLFSAKAHFILEVSQEGTKSAAAYFNALPEARGGNADAEARLGESVLRAFGPAAVFCHADEGISGFSVPHPFFALHGADIMRHRTEISGTGLPSTPSSRAHTSPKPDRGVSIDTLRRIPAIWRGEALRFSPSKLKAFLQCPFKWLLYSSPGIESLPSDPSILAEGSLMHSVIRMMMDNVKTLDGRIRADHMEEYISAFEDIFSRCLTDTLRQSGIALRPGLEALRLRLKDRMKRLLEFEIALHDEGWEIGDFELPLRMVFGEENIVLEGRADRVLNREGGDEVAIVDYKRNTIPTKKDLILREDGSLREFQVASYALMLASSGKNPRLGLYWSVEGSRSVTAFGPDGSRASWTEFEPERQELVRRVATSAERIRSGSSLKATPSAEACDACTLRSVCRALYSSENP